MSQHVAISLELAQQTVNFLTGLALDYQTGQIRAKLVESLAQARPVEFEGDDGDSDSSLIHESRGAGNRISGDDSNSKDRHRSLSGN